MLTYEVLLGETPFASAGENAEMETFTKIMRGTVACPLQVTSHTSRVTSHKLQALRFSTAL